MTPRDWQILEALYLALIEDSAPPHPLEKLGSLADDSVHYVGKKRFGSNWKIQSKHGNYEYIPQVYLSLGRMHKLGLVTKHPVNGQTYSSWGLTEKGFELAQGMVGPSPTSSYASEA